MLISYFFLTWLLSVQVIRGLDQGILGGEGVPAMQVGMILRTTDGLMVVLVLCIYLCYLMEMSNCCFFAGGKRKLKIPPRLAYGPEPAGCFSGDASM